MPRKPAPPRLIEGPYQAPPGRVGDPLICRIRGTVTISGFSRTPIPWPLCVVHGGRPSLIVCGGLACAVRTESVRSICHYWGVDRKTVWKWRQALKVERMTPGTSQRFSELTAGKVGPANARRAAEAAERRRRRTASGQEPGSEK